MSERFLVRSSSPSDQPFHLRDRARARTHTQHTPSRPLRDEKSPATGFHEPAGSPQNLADVQKNCVLSLPAPPSLSGVPSIHFLRSVPQHRCGVVLRFCASPNRRSKTRSSKTNMRMKSKQTEKAFYRYSPPSFLFPFSPLWYRAHVSYQSQEQLGSNVAFQDSWT